MAAEADLSGLADRLRSRLGRIDAAFTIASERLGDAVPCRRGCSSCCVAVFDIHPADALLLGRWLDGLGSAQRADVLARAGAILSRALEARPAGDWTPEAGLASLSSEEIDALARSVPQPCPVLGPEGECRAHEHRPAICRLQGIPWRDTGSGSVVPDLCRLDARQADLPPQPLDFAPIDAARWEIRDELAPQLGERLPRGRTFVAEALWRWNAHGMLPPSCC